MARRPTDCQPPAIRSRATAMPGRCLRSNTKSDPRASPHAGFRCAAPRAGEAQPTNVRRRTTAWRARRCHRDSVPDLPIDWITEPSLSFIHFRRTRLSQERRKAARNLNGCARRRDAQHIAQIAQELVFLIGLAEIKIDAELGRAVAMLFSRPLRDH